MHAHELDADEDCEEWSAVLRETPHPVMRKLPGNSGTVVASEGFLMANVTVGSGTRSLRLDLVGSAK